MKSTTITVDVAKEALELAVSVRPGQASEQRHLSRTAFPRLYADRPAATVVFEACGTASEHARGDSMMPPHRRPGFGPLWTEDAAANRMRRRA